MHFELNIYSYEVPLIVLFQEQRHEICTFQHEQKVKIGLDELL